MILSSISFKTIKCRNESTTLIQSSIVLKSFEFVSFALHLKALMRPFIDEKLVSLKLIDLLQSKIKSLGKKL